jgi:hypothetical protein
MDPLALGDREIIDGGDRPLLRRIDVLHLTVATRQIIVARQQEPESSVS